MPNDPDHTLSIPVQTLTVELGDRSYPIYIGGALLRERDLLNRHLGAGPAALVTNETVAALYLEPVRAALGDRLRVVKILPDGEQYKTLDVLSGIYDCLLDAGCDRQSTLLALGGGVVGDLTGFAAATYQRGVDFIQLPTTLLAQVDSSVGGKTGVNHVRGKNMIGAFHQPRCVIADTATLDSLPAREFASGLAEIIKYGLIADAAFHDWLCANIALLTARDQPALAQAVLRSCACKARIVALDERESGIRALLNFGHTFGHAIETATGYASYLHGEAVALGMVMAAQMSQRLGWIKREDCEAVRGLVRAAGLPVDVSETYDIDQFLALMGKDKKAVAGQPRLVLLQAIGHALLTTEYSQTELRGLLVEVLRDACVAPKDPDHVQLV